MKAIISANCSLQRMTVNLPDFYNTLSPSEQELILKEAVRRTITANDIKIYDLVKNF
jgi:hypothetical protein